MMTRALLLAAISIPLFAAATQESHRVKLGEVLGKPAYVDQVSGGEDAEIERSLSELFLMPVFEQYKSGIAAEVKPTKEEYEHFLSYHARVHEKRIGPRRAELQAELVKLDAELARTDLSAADRKNLEIQRFVTEGQLKPPGQAFAEFALDHWKVQRHLYEKFGGGRILWQQRGVEAFDAMHEFIKSEEKKGSFRIDDPAYRDLLYAYWTRDHGAFLTSDPDQIRDEFLSPKWALPVTTAAASAPSSRPSAGG